MLGSHCCILNARPPGGSQRGGGGGEFSHPSPSRRVGEPTGGGGGWRSGSSPSPPAPDKALHLLPPLLRAQHNSPGTKPPPPPLALSHKYSFLPALQKHTRGSTKELCFQRGRVGLGPATHLGSSSVLEGHTSGGAGTCADRRQTSTRSRESEPPHHPRGRCQIPCTQEDPEGLQRQSSQGGALSLPPRGDEKTQEKMQQLGRKARALRWAQRHQGQQPRHSG